MTKILSVIVASVMLSTAAFAANTNMSNNWTCTTNASSAANDADKAADDQMKNTAKAATDAFSFAADNCRDCTKITCEAKE
jgi:hypothetical protein